MEYLDEMVKTYAKMIMDRDPYNIYGTFTFEDVFVHIEQAQKCSDQLINKL